MGLKNIDEMGNWFSVIGVKIPHFLKTQIRNPMMKSVLWLFLIIIFVKMIFGSWVNDRFGNAQKKALFALLHLNLLRMYVSVSKKGLTNGCFSHKSREVRLLFENSILLRDDAVQWYTWSPWSPELNLEQHKAGALAKDAAAEKRPLWVRGAARDFSLT